MTRQRKSTAALALLFNLRFPLRRFARSLVIVPWLLPLFIVGTMFRYLFQLEGGAVNQILLDLHLISHPAGFLLSPNAAFVSLLITNIWLGIPFFTLLLYSALQDVPVELKEAAMLDGANAWQRLTRVTLPIIRPVIEVVFVLGFVFTVKVFEIVIALTQGGPANSTQLLARLRGRRQHGAAGPRPAGRTAVHLAEPGVAAAGGIA